MKTKVKVLCFCFAFVLSVAAQAGFIFDIHINAAENPTLTFGEADAPTRAPHPPFSGMFGVADVCFAGPEDAPEWYDRLAEDVKTANNANQWILVAKSNARLTFKLRAGGTPGDLYLVYNDVKTGTPATPVLISDGGSFPVKTGGVYTITRDNGAAPEDNPQGDSSEFVPKDGSGEVAITPPDGLQKIKISFVAPQGVVAYVDEDVTKRTPRINPSEVDWWFSVSRTGYKVGYDWTILYSELEVTLTPVVPPSRENTDLNVSMTPTRSGAPPVRTTLDFLDEQGDTLVGKTIDWILQKFGTLDVNKDAQFTTADVLLIDAFQKAFASAYIDTEDIDLALQQLSLDQVKDFLRGVNKDFATAEAFEELLNSWEEFAGIDGVDEFSTADVLVIDAIQKAYASLFIEYENASMAVGNLNLTEIKDKLRGLNKNFATENSVEQGKSLIDF